MTWQEALEVVIRHTRHERYRALCADGHPEHEGWRRRITGRAAELEGRPDPPPPPAPIPVPEALALTRRMAACPYRSTGPGCGCGGARCALRGGSIVSHCDCFDCLGKYPG